MSSQRYRLSNEQLDADAELYRRLLTHPQLAQLQVVGCTDHKSFITFDEFLHQRYVSTYDSSPLTAREAALIGARAAHRYLQEHLREAYP